MQNSNCKLILGIVITFTLIQLTILFIFGYTPYPDSNAYIQLAIEFMSRRGINVSEFKGLSLNNTGAYNYDFGG